MDQFTPVVSSSNSSTDLSQQTFNVNEFANYESGDLSSTEYEDLPARFHISTQRKISLTSELIADSSPMRHALFRHTNCADQDSDICADAPFEGQPKVVVENYRNKNYGTSESHEMATIVDVDDALAKDSEHMVCIRKLEHAVPTVTSADTTSVLGDILAIVNLLAGRMGALEGKMSSLQAKLQKTVVCTHRQRYRKAKLPVVVSSLANNVQSSGDDHDAVLRERERESARAASQSAANEEDRYREMREIREYRMNRFFYKKTLETENLNQRPVRHFTLPEPPKDLKSASVGVAI